MTRKRQSESVSTGSTRVLRSQKPTTIDGTVEEKAQGKGNRPMVVNEKEKVKKIVAHVKLNGDVRNGEIAGKRKVMAHEGSAEASGSRVKKVKTVYENEMAKGAASGSTRVLRSLSAKKSDEALNEQAVRNKPVKKGSERRAKTNNEANNASIVHNGPESTSRRTTRAAAKDQSASKKRLNGKAVEEAESDGGILPSENIKNSPLHSGIPEAKKNLGGEPSKRIPTKGGKSKVAPTQKNARDTAAGASSNKPVPKQVSKSQPKRRGVQASTRSRRNPTRKARADTKTN